jgi:hypothetical protein
MGVRRKAKGPLASLIAAWADLWIKGSDRLRRSADGVNFQRDQTLNDEWRLSAPVMPFFRQTR